jgi:hypothetical protein
LAAQVERTEQHAAFEPFTHGAVGLG